MLLEENRLKNFQFVSQEIRELDCLVEGIMAIEGNKNVKLSNFLWPEKFDTIVTAVRNVTWIQWREWSAGSGYPISCVKGWVLASKMRSNFDWPGTAFQR